MTAQNGRTLPRICLPGRPLNLSADKKSIEVVVTSHGFGRGLLALLPLLYHSVVKLPEPESVHEFF